jgi:hypothetical protein
MTRRHERLSSIKYRSRQRKRRISHYSIRNRESNI